MKKVFLYCLSLISVAIYLVASSDKLINKIAHEKYASTSLLSSDRYRFGDLYGLAYVPGFRSRQDNNLIKKIIYNGTPKDIDVYALCDSYLWSFVKGDSDFTRCNKYKFARTNYKENLAITLEPSKKNVIILEFAERNILDGLNDTSYLYHFLDSKKEFQVPDSSFIKAKEFLFNENINANLEFLTWDFKFLRPIKEFKGYINSLLSKKINNDVVISEDNKNLFLQATIDTASTWSSFHYVSDNKVDSLVKKINNLSDYCRKAGFKYVYLSLIPNPVSIISPTYHGLVYNNLIQRIESNSLLGVPVIDIYPIFKKCEIPLYYPSDTHWNMNGYHIWLNEVNDTLSHL